MVSFRLTLQRNENPFFQLQIRFRIDGRKPNIIQKNSEAWILIKVQCVLYQWISFDTLYKLNGGFSNLVIIFELLAEKQKNIQKDREESILIKILQFFKII